VSINKDLVERFTPADAGSEDALGPARLRSSLAAREPVKRMLPITVALAGSCCIVAAYFCHFYYTLYQQTHTELQVNMDGQIDSLRQEVARLARQKHFRPIRARGWLSTSDLQPDESHGYTTNTITLGQSKTGWVITPELRLRSGSPDLQEFKIRLWPTNTRVMDAWISPPGQPEILAVFDTFSISPDEGTNSLTLRVRAKPGTSARCDFTVVVLRDSDNEIHE
jgi:hypothetical protein